MLFRSFGDGTTSTLALPIHQYADTGMYVVTLTAYNAAISDTLTQSIHIMTLGYSHPIYQILVSNDTVYCKITGGVWSANSLTWYFSDGASISSVADTFHVFQDTGSYNIDIRTYNGCGMFLRDTLITITNITTSINEKGGSNSSFIIYPNPAQHDINIKSKNNEAIKQLSVYDMLGQKLFDSFDLKNNSQIDVSQLQKGSYVIYIKTEHKYYYHKFIKQ